MIGQLFEFGVPLPSISATLGLAAVAALGYLVGRWSRQARVVEKSTNEDLRRALSDARQLEQITDEMLRVTRAALDHCQRLRAHRPKRKGQAAGAVGQPL